MDIIKELGIQQTNSGHKKRFVIARCKCGKEFKVAKNAINSGNTKSCGCSINRKKPLTSYPQYWVLQDMKKRCYNKNQQYYYLYGGRGIIVCDEWLKNPKAFIDFTIDKGYKKGLYIDRIDPNGNYQPSNCRFVNSRVNATNTRLLGKNNKSGYRGVSKHKNHKGKTQWRSRITYKGDIISLGVYETKIEAANAYDEYVLKHNLGHPTNKSATKKKIN